MGNPIGFGEFERALMLHDREPVQVRFGIARRAPSGVFLGVMPVSLTAGLLRLLGPDDVPSGSEPPPDWANEPRQRGIAFKVGGSTFGVTSADFVQATKAEGVISVQVGPVVLSMNFRVEDFRDRDG